MKALLVICAAAMLVAGCESGGSYGGDTVAPVTGNTPPPATSGKISFTSFVSSVAAQDADAEPLEVNDDNLLFDAEYDPQAFDALILSSE